VTHAAVGEELARVLGYYTLGELRAARQTKRGFVNDCWIVETEQGRYFLKRRHPRLRRPSLIRAQHDLVERLRSVGFPAPTVIPTATGETLLALDGELYEIHGYIEGDPYDHHRPEHLDEAALTLGHYHTHVKGFARRVLRRWSDLYNPAILSTVMARLTEAWALDRTPEFAQVTRQLEAQAVDLTARFARHGTLPRLVIHGDYWAGNLLFDDDSIAGVVDYDQASWQPRVVELAEALIYFASPRLGHLKHLVYPSFMEWKPFTGFLQGYARAVVLEANEIAALPDYVCCIWFSVSLECLLKKGTRPPEALEALREVLALGNWASSNADQMVKLARSAMHSGLC